MDNTTKPVNIDGHDLSTLFLCSMRYAIGRHTYMPSLIISIINSHKDSLPLDEKRLLAQNIQSELNSLQFFHDKDPDSLNTKVKLEEKSMWENLIKNLMEE